MGFATRIIRGRTTSATQEQANEHEARRNQDEHLSNGRQLVLSEMRQGLRAETGQSAVLPELQGGEMRDARTYRTVIATQAELDGLPPFSYELIYSNPDPAQFFRSCSTAEGHAPMVVRLVDDPLSDYPREVWYWVNIETPLPG
jgi:hypothetical protein